MRTTNKQQSPSPPEGVMPRKRFRLERLEERIAPKKKTAGPSDSGGGWSKTVY